MLYLLLLAIISADLEIEFNLDNPTINNTYTNAFKITNLDYTTNSSTIEFNLSYNHSNKTHTINKQVNKFTTAKTSNITFYNNKTQTICATLLVQDQNPENNRVCKTFFQILVENNTNNGSNNNSDNQSDNSSESEENPPAPSPDFSNQECEELINFSPPAIYQSSAKLKYKINSNGEEYEAEYWVEDLQGNVVKPPRVSSNSNTKSFTPKIAGGYIFWIKLNRCEANTFFLVVKEGEDTVDIKKMGPSTVEFSYTANGFVEDGIQLYLNDELLFTADYVGEHSMELQLPELCGENELLLVLGEQELTEMHILDECEDDFITGKEIIIDNSLDNNAAVEQNLKELREEISKINLRSNTPTAAITAIPQSERQSSSWLYVLLIILALNAFADKFKKLKKSITNNEQKRDKSKS